MITFLVWNKHLDYFFVSSFTTLLPWQAIICYLNDVLHENKLWSYDTIQMEFLWFIFNFKKKKATTKSSVFTAIKKLRLHTIKSNHPTVNVQKQWNLFIYKNIHFPTHFLNYAHKQYSYVSHYMVWHFGRSITGFPCYTWRLDPKDALWCNKLFSSHSSDCMPICLSIFCSLRFLMRSLKSSSSCLCFSIRNRHVIASHLYKLYTCLS